MNNDTSDKATKGAALLVAMMSSFLFPFMSSAINIALPSIGEEFRLDAVTINWIATSFLLVAAMFLVPFGRLGDIHGRKRIFIYGIITYIVASLLSAISSNVTLLISFRILQGIGGAMISGTAVAILTSVFPSSERGKVLGINIATVYIGLSLGPPLGGFLTQHFGWRSIFLANVFLGLVVLVTVLWKLKGEWAEAKGEKFDLAGSIIYSLGLAATIYGLSLLPTMLGAWLIVIGILCIFTFIRWEMRAKSPVLSIGLFRHNAAFTFSNLAALINYSATFAVGFLLSLYLQYIKGLNPESAGLILISMPVVQAILSPFTGRLSDRIEPRILASAGMLLTFIGLFLFIFLSEKTTLAFVTGNLILLGFGFALFSSPNTNAVMSSVEKKYYGVAAGTLATMRLTGQMLSMAIALLLFALYMGRVQITPEYYPLFLKSGQTAFIVFACLCFGGVFASLARGNTR